MKPRLRSRWTVAAVAAVLAAAIGIAVAAGSSSEITTRQQFITGTPEGAQPVKLDTTLYLPRLNSRAGDPARARLRRHQGLGRR